MKKTFFEEQKTCKVCHVECFIHRRSPVCTPCRTKLFQEKRVWCSACNTIGEAWTTRPHAECWVCHRARVLPRERAYMEKRRSQGYRRAYEVKPVKSQTDKERDTISQMLDHGMAIRQIARVLHISRGRVRSTIMHGAAQAAGSKAHTGTMTPVLTSMQLEQVFRHVNGHRLSTWRRYGFPMQPYGKEVTKTKQANPNPDPYRTQMYYITEEALETWMSKMDSWMLWDIDDVIDPFWKAFAKEVRNIPGRWMTLKETAPHLGLLPGSFKRRIREGDYTGRWCKTLAQYWVWSEDVIDHALRYDGRTITISEETCGQIGMKRG